MLEDPKGQGHWSVLGEDGDRGGREWVGPCPVGHPGAYPWE